MAHAILTPHHSTPCPAVHGIAVRLDNVDDGGLRLVYTLAGDLAALRIPELAPPSRQNGLWRHTCFELFISAEGDSAYREFNFSPAGAWACYDFSAYREGGMLAAIPAPSIRCKTTAGHLELTATLSALALPDGKSFRIGLSAVAETDAGNLSYWALRHPPGKPDFHHTDAFALTFACP